MNNLYTIWVHGHDGWKWSEDCQCYLYRNKDNVFSPPDDYCLGDRMIWNMAGHDSYGIIWRGSSSDHWGGMHFGFDLGAAIRWVQASPAKKLGCKLWSKSNEEGPRPHYLRLEKE